MGPHLSQIYTSFTMMRFLLLLAFATIPLLNVQPQSNVRMMNTLALVHMTKRLDATHMTLACHTRTNMAVQLTVRCSVLKMENFALVELMHRVSIKENIVLLLT